jgi:gliding motility-associated-like protein
MKYVCIIALALISFSASAQFQDKWKVKFPSESEPLQVKWADVNNDSILDVVVAHKINDKVSFVAYADSAFASTHELVKTGFVSGTFSLCDFNLDNRLDIIMSGIDTLGNHATELYVWSESFVYQKQTTPLLAFSSPKVVFADLNSDGKDEFVVAGEDGHLSAWRWDGTSAALLFDSTNIVAHDILVYDFDGNGYNDIAVSGTDAANQPKMLIIEFANAFDTIRTIRFQAPISGKMDAGDLDNNGSIDLLVSGIDSDGNIVTQTFVNQVTTFATGLATWNGVSATSLRIADVDADGEADMSVQGLQNTTPLNFIRTASGDSILLPTQHVVTQEFGDYDRDGDLDVLQLQDTLGLVLLENQTTNVNPRGDMPDFEAMLFIYDRYFLYWHPDSADYQVGSTYDLMLFENDSVKYGGEFDVVLERANWQRLTVTHGNRSTNNFALLRIPFGVDAVGVQTVDKAFVGSRPRFCPETGGPGIVTGGGANCPPEQQTITACSDDPIKLIPNKPLYPTAWFSFSKGFLGLQADSLMVESKADTIFSLTMSGGNDCERMRIYLINDSGGEDTIRVTKNTTVCEDTAVNLTVADEWEDVIWRNPAKDSIGSGDTLHYVVRREEVLTANAHNPRGCVLHQTENLHISKPALTTNGEVFRIMKGESVSLSASGAHVYVWTPNESLDNGFIPNPVATPALTTTYDLVGYDTLGCTDTTKVIVQVEQTAFVPNLFTPDGDGMNDQLKIYGLSQANNFRFAIHNRDGNIVYETSDVAAISSFGWDGSKQGVAQPPGLYYWKVEGTFGNGSHLQLNGRTNGSILMVR